MHYQLPTQNYARTTDYVGTVLTKDDESLANLKESVRRNNTYVRNTSREYGRPIGILLRIRIKARGPRRASYYHTLDEDATHYDVYQGEDTGAMYMLRRELETGLTSSEIRKMDHYFWKAKELEYKGKWRLKQKGFL